MFSLKAVWIFMSFSLIVEKPEEVDAGVLPITGEMIRWESDGSLEVVRTHTHRQQQILQIR